MAIFNFSYLIDGQLAGCGLPGGMNGDLEGDLRELHSKGVRAIVTAREVPLDESTVKAQGFDYLYLPVRDFSPPTMEQFETFRDFVARHAEQGGQPVVVHCRAGIGRTGTLLASWLIARGMTVEDAVREVRKSRPGSIETSEQVDALCEWAKRVRSSD